jgi:hypothetical protein
MERIAKAHGSEERRVGEGPPNLKRAPSVARLPPELASLARLVPKKFGRASRLTKYWTTATNQAESGWGGLIRLADFGRMRPAVSGHSSSTRLDILQAPPMLSDGWSTNTTT